MFCEPLELGFYIVGLIILFVLVFILIELNYRRRNYKKQTVHFDPDIEKLRQKLKTLVLED